MRSKEQRTKSKEREEVRKLENGDGSQKFGDRSTMHDTRCKNKEREGDRRQETGVGSQETGDGSQKS